MAEAQYIATLTAECSRETKRANDNALQTIKLGRWLSIMAKTLVAVRRVMVACMNLRRFEGKEGTGNPLETAAAGYLCLQDGKELDEAIQAASKALEQLEKEYPETR